MWRSCRDVKMAHQVPPSVNCSLDEIDLNALKVYLFNILFKINTYFSFNFIDSFKSFRITWKLIILVYKTKIGKKMSLGVVFVMLYVYARVCVFVLYIYNICSILRLYFISGLGFLNDIRFAYRIKLRWFGLETKICTL